MSQVATDARELVARYGDAVPEVHISFIGNACQPSDTSLGITHLGYSYPYRSKNSLYNFD
jgi:hypothetical protein